MQTSVQQHTHDYQWSSAEGFDLALYPRTYIMSPGWKLLLVAFAAILGIAGLVGGAHFLRADTPGIFARMLLAALCAIFSGLSLYTLWTALSYRVVLTADAVEVVEPFRRRQMRRADIGGRRLLRTGQGFSVLQLESRDKRAKKLKIPLLLKTDQAFERWYSTMVDLDAQEIHQSEEELEHALYIHLPPQERARTIARLRHLAKWFNGVTAALLVGGFILPDSDHWLPAILVALPWVAIWLVARFQPLYRFAARRNDSHPDLTLGLMVPGLVLTMLVLPKFHTLDWRAPLVMACAGGLLLTGVAARIDPWFRQQRWSVILAGLFTCAYGYGAGLELNASADPSPAQIYPVTVLAKRVSHGSRSTTWYLRLEPWGPVSDAREVTVSAAQYRRTRAGDTVCIFLGSGALRIAWYEVGSCKR